ncbi:unnamed protein product [Phytomonas sp. Hart1]|nr:unnamed protein product [Phytomonas sp. Hart1]|eukprot:CCW68308.1 unnamed protein product [Phytomonas sp. isolate Hart1]
MLRRVFSRGQFPSSAPVLALSELPAAKAKTVKANALSLHFVTKSQVKNGDRPGKAAPGFDGSAGKVHLISCKKSAKDAAASDSTPIGQTHELFAGCGTSGHIRDYRLAITNAVRQARQIGTRYLNIHPPTTDVLTTADVFHPARALTKQEVAEKTACYAATAAYEYNRLKTGKAKAVEAVYAGAVESPSPVKSPSRGKPDAEKEPPMEMVIASGEALAVKTGAVIGACINDARNLGNLREDEGVPEFYVEWAKKYVLSEGVVLRKVLRGRQVEEAGMNLLYSVGKGSVHEPYVMVLEYVGNKGVAHSTALVGKGVTFDCGGLNVKPFGSMEGMHMDMMGAGVVLATLKAAATLQLPINLVAAVGLAENAIGPSSYAPSSILTSLAGPTVEVLNTDAEGRLVLADVLTYVQRHSKLAKVPQTIIDLATLTGAIIVGLGNRRAGLFSNSAQLSEKLMLTGTTSGEELWPMPIGDEHAELMKGGLADLVNVSPGKSGGGSSTAAAFLSHFVEPGKEWAHIDIAGVSDVGDKPKGFHPAGATGYGVQLLIDFLRHK